LLTGAGAAGLGLAGGLVCAKEFIKKNSVITQINTFFILSFKIFKKGGPYGT
jgi:hypothetical protein